MTILAHKHDWSSTNAGYGCTQCSAVLTHADILANPGPAGVHPAQHAGNKLNK